MRTTDGMKNDHCRRNGLMMERESTGTMDQLASLLAADFHLNASVEAADAGNDR